MRAVLVVPAGGADFGPPRYVSKIRAARPLFDRRAMHLFALSFASWCALARHTYILHSATNGALCGAVGNK